MLSLYFKQLIKPQIFLKNKGINYISYIAHEYNDYYKDYRDYDEYKKHEEIIVPVTKQFVTTTDYQDQIDISDNTLPLNKENELHYIYLVKPKDTIFIENKSNKNIYKLGKSIVSAKDFIEPKIRNKQKNELIIVSKCINAPILETNILIEFNKNFEKYKFGNKFFIGNEFKMLNLINLMILNEYKINNSNK
jgi:hypothetical protein